MNLFRVTFLREKRASFLYHIFSLDFELKFEHCFLPDHFKEYAL